MSTIALASLVAYAAVVAVVLAVRVRAARAVRAADRPLGEGLPTGAALAQRLLEAEGLGVVQVVDADVDAYRAVTRELQFAPGRADRASVAAWAIAAHEVAHAAMHRAGDRAWARWWVLSGHGVWASIALPVLLLITMVVGSVVPWLLAMGCASILIVGGLHSIVVERRAVRAAARLLTSADLPDDLAARAAQLVHRTAAGYIAESFLDTSALDRFTGPSRAVAAA